MGSRTRLVTERLVFSNGSTYILDYTEDVAILFFKGSEVLIPLSVLKTLHEHADKARLDKLLHGK